MLSDLLLRLRSLFRRDLVERELDEELRFHLEQQSEAYMRDGLSRDDAVRRARQEIGSLEQIREEHRDARGIALLTHLGRDLRHGLRQFGRSPGFTALAVLCLGLGIGVNTSIFGVLNAVVFRPMPVESPQRLVVVTRGDAGWFPYRVYRDLLERARTLAGIAAVMPSESDLDVDGESRFVAAEAVSANYAQVLGVTPALGRWFTQDDEPAAVIGYAVWRDRFNLAPDVIGHLIKSESQTYTVVGVAPPDYGGVFSPLRTDLWVPVRTRPSLTALLDDRARERFMLFGRLSDGATGAQASAELNAIYAQVRAEFPATPEATAPMVADQVRGIANPANRRGTQVAATFLMVVVGLVLLIACVNVGNLLLVRGAVRQREFAVRRALGASRSRVLQQILTESLLLALAGGVCGLAFAFWTTSVLERSLPMVEGLFPIQLNLDLDWRVIAFATLVSMATTVLCGLLPARRASRTDGLVAFKGDIVAGAPRRRPLGLVAQVVMSFALLLVAGTFIQALVRMQTADPGFAVDGRLYAYTYFANPAMTPQTKHLLYERAIEQLRNTPAVRSAALTYSLPLMPSGSDCVARPSGSRITVGSVAVDPGYFDTMRIRRLEGRDFATTDVANGGTVVVMNERLAKQLWPDVSAVGQRVLIGCETPAPATIVGVVATSSVRAVGEMPQPYLYFALAQRYEGGLTTILIETSTPPATLIEPVRRTLLEIGQGIRVYTVQPLSTHVEKSFSSIRWQTAVLTAFGVLALILAAIGLYGVITYRVALRTREIGVRMALGASRRNVFREVVGQGLSIALVGVAIGEALMLGVGRLLGSLDADIRPPGLIVLGITGLIWMIVAIVATYAPAARASGVNPLIALRYE